MSKGFGNLLIKFLTIGNNNNFRITRIHFFQNVFCQHNHCKRFSATLSMPNNTALTIAGSVIGIYCFDDFLYRKKLLITAYLFDVSVIQNKVFCEFQKPVGREQRDEASVLRSWLSACYMLLNEFVLPINIFFAPDTPEIFTCSAGCIFN